MVNYLEVWYSSVLRPTRHIIGHFGDDFTGQMTNQQCHSTEGRKTGTSDSVATFISSPDIPLGSGDHSLSRKHGRSQLFIAVAIFWLELAMNISLSWNSQMTMLVSTESNCNYY